MSQEIRLRWTSHQETILTIFNDLLKTETLVDVTLAAEGRFLKAHQVILAASSSFFQDVLAQDSCNDKHPIIFLNDVKYTELQAIISYMYRGEATILQDDLPSLLKVAESLRIRGLFNQEKENQAVQPPPLPQEEPPTPTPADEEEDDLVEDEEQCDGSEFYDVDDFDDSAEPLVKAELNEKEEDGDGTSPSTSHQFNLNFDLSSLGIPGSLPQYHNQDESSNTEKESYECPKCGKKYTSNKSLWRHRKFACEGKQAFECSLCGKIFSRSDNLRRHAVVAHCAT